MLIIKDNSKDTIKIATKILNEDGIICFATETVYALACNAASDNAVTKLYKIKKRNPKKPIAIFTKDLTTAKQFLIFNSLENKIAQSLMPGMITLILKQKALENQKISPLLNNNTNSLGLRIPNHQFALKLLNAFDGIIAATSANVSNKEPATNCMQAKQYFDNKIDLIIDSKKCKEKIPSTILQINNNQVIFLREGLVTKNQINNLL